MPKTTWLLAGAALALSAGAGVAIAQDAKPPARDDRRVERDVRVYRFEDGPQSFVIERDGDRSVRVERRGGGDERHVRVIRAGHSREQHLKDVLQLRPNQEPALKAFLEATSRSHVHGANVMRFDSRSDGQTTAERLAKMEQQLAEQQASARRRIDATRAFYAQLDDRQKKAFDAMPMLMMAGPGFGPMLLPGPASMVRLERPPRPPMPPRTPEPPEPPPPPR
jgi:hypothetical protein